MYFFVVLCIFCVVICIVCFVSFSVLFVCVCVLNYSHRVATQLQLNIYHIVSYHMSYHIITANTVWRRVTYIWMLVNCDSEGCTRSRAPPDACILRMPIILSFALIKQRTLKLLADRLRVEASALRMPGCTKPAPSIPSPLGTCLRLFVRKESWVINLMFVDPCIIVQFVKKNPTRCNNVSKFYYSMFIWNSTCFGWHTAHHQEPKTALAAFGFSYVELCLDV